MGDINVYSGPMKSGKTNEILNEYKRQLVAGKSVEMFKPSIDTRGKTNFVVSRNGIDIPAITINNIADLQNYDADVYCIDEFQFLDGNIKVIQEMADNGKKFYISGLNLTAERHPFGKMADLLCIADNIHFLNAICDNCKNENATLTYYKGSKNTDIVIGDHEYMSLCRNCYNEFTKNNKDD